MGQMGKREGLSLQPAVATINVIIHVRHITAHTIECMFHPLVFLKNNLLPSCRLTREPVVWDS